MKLLGYSERSMINSFFHEMYYTKNNSMLASFLNKITFPYLNSVSYFSPVKEATIFIEQSFSDFGDSDIVILADNGNGQKYVIFIEAKVCGYGKKWSIVKEFERFEKSIIKLPKKDSNLFSQLYFKQKLIELIINNKSAVKLNKISIKFPNCFSKKRNDRNLGNNEVVLKAVGMIRNYCNIDNTFFVSLTPDCTTKLDVFYKNTLVKYTPPPNLLWKWDIKNWGYISWEIVEDFCNINGFVNTIGMFAFNKAHDQHSCNVLQSKQKYIISLT